MQEAEKKMWRNYSATHFQRFKLGNEKADKENLQQMTLFLSNGVIDFVC